MEKGNLAESFVWSLIYSVPTVNHVKADDRKSGGCAAVSAAGQAGALQLQEQYDWLIDVIN